MARRFSDLPAAPAAVTTSEMMLRTVDGLFIRTPLSALVALLGAGGGGGGKPLAPSNQVADVATGSKTLVQAFADLDAYDYSNGYTRQINIPVAYVFTPADVLILISRNDCGTLSIISAQFPAPHTVSGTFPMNFALGTASVLLGLSQSTVGQIKLSIDGSTADAGSNLCPFGAVDSDVEIIGDPFTGEQAIFKAGPASTQAVMLEALRGVYHLYSANCGSVVNATGALMRVTALAAPSPSTPLVVWGAFYATSGNVLVSDGAYAWVQGSLSPIVIQLAGGAHKVWCDGSVSCQGSATFHALDGYQVFEAVGPLNLSFSGANVWQPAAAGEALVALSGYGLQGTHHAIYAYGGVSLDFSVAPAHGPLVRLAGQYSLIVDVSPMAAWDAQPLYDSPANVRNAYNSIINDITQLATLVNDGAAGTITPGENSRSVKVTNAALAALVMDHSNLPPHAECVVYFQADVAALTISGAGAGAVFNAPAAIAAGKAYRIARTDAGDLVVS